MKEDTMKEKALLRAIETSENQIDIQIACNAKKLFQIAANVLGFVKERYGQEGLDLLIDLVHKHQGGWTESTESETGNESD